MPGGSIIHINSHYASGVIIASIFLNILQLTFLEYLLIVVSAFILDLDILFSKYAKNHNHRMLITHSIIPGGIVIILGLIFLSPAVILSGCILLVHVIIDSFDWGTNLFYFPKTLHGFKMLISKEEFNNLDRYLAQYNDPASFFDFKYYNSKPCLLAELILFILMIFSVVFLAIEYFYFIFFYFIFLLFHLSRHKYLKDKEN